MSDVRGPFAVRLSNRSGSIRALTYITSITISITRIYDCMS